MHGSAFLFLLLTIVCNEYCLGASYIPALRNKCYVLAYLDPMSKKHIDALLALKGELKLNVKMIALTNILETPAGGFMSRAEAQSVRAKTGDDQQVEQIIEILLGKSDKDFSIFCQMLQECNYPVWAHQLELQAEAFKTSAGMKHHLIAFLLLFGVVAGNPIVFIIVIGLQLHAIS